MHKKIKVGIIFGGRSAEHEVSLQSAKNIIEAIDKDTYDLVCVGISKNREWLLYDSKELFLNSDDPKRIALNASKGHPAVLIPHGERKITRLDVYLQDEHIDVVFPVLHGTFGEDGTIQGLLKLADIPFVGAGVLGSAVGMDKDVMKRLLRDAGIPIAKFLAIKESNAPQYEEVQEKLGTPFFVKPANLGSSVGVHKVTNKDEFIKATQDAWKYDRKILCEEYIKGREIECSVLGNDNPIASIPGEITLHSEFYSYEAKYIDAQGATCEIPATLPDKIVKKIQQLAIQTFTVLSCEGLGRVDFFLKENGDVLVNEINTMPGFTAVSMYPKLWEASGISYPELISRLITLAFERFEKEKKLETSYDGE
ncbi:MAG: D-alanine--D-alanine ligase [Candidatus Azambacteria bacterium]|nr:D-alanine--D-alanine ligase [Candidatus Azambacteria bacterium]